MTATGGKALTLYLLPARGDRYRLLSPELEEKLADAGADEPEEREEPAAVGEEEGPGRRWIRSGVRWLEARGGPTERVLKELRLPDAIEVIHPAGLPARAARRVFRERIEESVQRHRRWMVVDGALVPLSVVLSLVPGPNLILPYLAWRAAAHWRGQRGGSRALAEAGLDATFVADPTLDPLLDLAERRFVLHRKRRLRAIGEAAGIPELDRHL